MAWIKKLCPLLLFLGSLILFLCTLAPGVTFVDSGELIVTAKNLGVAHPPGFPLYLLIAHLATLLPIGNVAQRVNFVSAFCAAIAVVLVYLVTVEAIRSWQWHAPKQTAGKGRLPAKQVFLPEQFMVFSGLVAGTLAACSRTLWSYATVAEVYTLNALLILLVFLLVFHWRNQILGWEATVMLQLQQPRSKKAGKAESTAVDISSDSVQHKKNRWLYIAAFVFGLALGVHHVTVALTLPALAWLVYATKGTKAFRNRQLIIAALACSIGLCIYLYLPWAAARSPVLNWGNPGTLERFWTHVTGSQYQSNFSLSPDQAQRQIASFIKLLFHEFNWPWFPAGLVIAGIGLYSLYRKDRILLVFLILIVVFNLLFAVGYDIAEDKDAYSLPIFLAIAIAAGFGAYAILASCKAQQRAAAAAIILLVLALTFAANVRISNRRDYYVAEDYIHNILHTVSSGGLLLTADWQVASPMLYFQEIERQRPDAICLDVLLLRRSWYYAYLESKYPALMHDTRASVQLFMEDLLQWEADPDAYRRDIQLTQRIDNRFCSMVSALVKNQLAAGPVYATSDVVLSSGGENQTLAKTLLGNYQIVPQGLVFQLFADRGFHQTALPQLRMRGLLNRSAAIDADAVVRQKVLPVYATMLVNCGRVFAAQGDSKRAMEAYRRAWSVDSAYIAEHNLLPPGISF